MVGGGLGPVNEDTVVASEGSAAFMEGIEWN